MPRKKVRYTEIYEASCEAPEIVFADIYSDIDDEEIQGIIEDQNGLPCDAGGYPGEWCTGCHWGNYELIEDYEEEVDGEDDYYA